MLQIVAKLIRLLANLFCGHHARLEWLGGGLWYCPRCGRKVRYTGDKE